MDVIDGLVTRGRRSGALAIRTDSRAGSYSYEKFCTTAWKAGNLLRHYGVRNGATVAIDTGETLSPPPLTAFLGAALLGATVQFDPTDPVEARALVAPAHRIRTSDPSPGTQMLAYGDEVDDPETAHFEREVWSENPTMPPGEVSPEVALLAVGENRYTHGQILATAERVASDFDLDTDDLVAVRAPLSEPGTVVAGILAPLTAGAAMLVDEAQTGTVGVGQVGPESRQVDPTTVL